MCFYLSEMHVSFLFKKANLLFIVYIVGVTI